MILDNIRVLCKKNNVAISMLEKSTGLGKKTIYRWNDKHPSVDKLKRVADYFGVTVDELLADTSRAG